MSGTLICGRHTASDAIIPVEVNADGTLEMTAEIDSSALAKETTLESLRTENASNLGTIAATLDDGTQKAQVLGNTEGDGSGTSKHIHVDSNGNVNSQIINTVSTNAFRTVIGDGSTNSHALVDSDGHLQVDVLNTANVKFEDISSSLNSGTNDDPANSLACGMRGRTTITDKTTETFCLVDSQGHLQVDVLSGGGSGGSSTFTIESKSVPDNTLTIIGDNTNAYIDTNGGNKFTISVLSATFTGSPAMNIEWSDNTSFSAGKVFVCNGYIGGSAVTTPVSLQSVTRLDGTTLAIQGICAFENIPARYARITIEQTSGGAIVYVGNSVLSP